MNLSAEIFSIQRKMEFHQMGEKYLIFNILYFK